MIVLPLSLDIQMAARRIGVMWEEVGIDMGLPFEEKVKLYHMQMLG